MNWILPLLPLVLSYTLHLYIRTGPGMNILQCLPANSSSAMMYASIRYRGLDLIRCIWKARLQHWSIAQKLVGVTDPNFQAMFDYEAKVSMCSSRLGLDVVNIEKSYSLKNVRQGIQEKAFGTGTIHKSKANHARNVNHENLVILLIDFFKFYSKDFNYKMKTICITDGGSDINQLDPVTNCAIFPKSSISIEDPLCPGNDISGGSYRYQQVISEFGNAYASLTEVVNPMSTISASSSKKSVLGRILAITTDDINLRKWTAQQFK